MACWKYFLFIQISYNCCAWQCQPLNVWGKLSVKLWQTTTTIYVLQYIFLQSQYILPIFNIFAFCFIKGQKKIDFGEIWVEFLHISRRLAEQKTCIFRFSNRWQGIRLSIDCNKDSFKGKGGLGIGNFMKYLAIPFSFKIQFNSIHFFHFAQTCIRFTIPIRLCVIETTDPGCDASHHGHQQDQGQRVHQPGQRQDRQRVLRLHGVPHRLHVHPQVLQAAQVGYGSKGFPKKCLKKVHPLLPRDVNVAIWWELRWKYFYTN